jgi:hypothetical protein
VGIWNSMTTMEKSSGIDGFLSPASFWFPEALVESAWHGHAPFAFWLMETLKPRQFVELGTHHGFSYLAFCQAAQRCGLAAKGYAVDTWRGDEHAGFYEMRFTPASESITIRAMAAFPGWSDPRSMRRCPISRTARSTCCISTDGIITRM